MSRRTLLQRSMTVAAMLLLAATARSAEAITAKAIYDATGVQGGLVVHLGCGNGELTAALRASDRYLVHGLDNDPAKVEAARATLHAKGLNGPVAVDVLRGQKLPYVDDLASLIVASELDGVSIAEVRRVLAPGGVGYISRGDRWEKIVEPRPEAIDQWSHFLHDASGNAVAADTEVGPPKRLRWVAEPRWCRSHEFPSSVNAVVTVGGRIFTIFDEGPTGIYEKMPQDCKVVARDAASGVLLWKVPLQKWQPEFGTGRGNRWNIHHTIPRRLVADADRVYVTLQFLDSPVSVLDAATGEILVEALEDTEGADEMLLCDGVLIVKTTEGRSVAATARIGKDALDDALVAVDVESGKVLWRADDVGVVPYALSADAGRVVYHNLHELVCLDLRAGKEIWRAPNDVVATVGAASTLVIDDGVVLFNGNTAVEEPGAKKKKGRRSRGLWLTAYSLEDGKQLWRQRGSRGQAAACTQPSDLFVVDGIVWCGGSLKGLDLHTGEVRKTLSIGQLISPGHHYRCHRSKATENFLIWPKRGAEFLDLEGNAHMRNDWLRAPCFTGATPANGLLYVPPSQCFCYPGVKVSGFLAMAAEPTEPVQPSGEAQLNRGPAFGKIEKAAEATAADWPTHRHDPRRSGSTESAVSASLNQHWQVELAGQGSQAVVVGDRLWVVEKDAHRVRCLSVADGNELWSFTAAGRIDSAPTIHQGMVLFGCRDGHVYCLRATDGALAWRFRAAPGERRVVSFGQVESVWPVHGAVLVQDGVVYFAAGRSSFLDGGLVVYGLDPSTGRVLHHHTLEGPWPDVMTDVGRPFAMEGALPDVLVSDGEDLYMQRIKFDAELNRLETPRESDLGELAMGTNHLAATGGLLDDTGFDRLYWMYGKRWPGFYFAQHAPKSGQLVVFNDATTYAVKYFYRRIQWSPAFLPAEHGYLLFADANDNEPILEEKGSSLKPIHWLPEEAYADKHRRGGRGVEKGSGYQRARPSLWQKMIPVRIRAMVLAGDRLVVAGPPDVVDPDDPTAALEGREGALLQVYSAADGKLLKSQKLAVAPAFDGLIAARGRVYLSTECGKLLCFGD